MEGQLRLRALLQDGEIKALSVTPEKAAQMLGISRNHAYGMVRKGEIPAVRLGRRWLVPVAALERLLEAVK